MHLRFSNPDTRMPQCVNRLTFEVDQLYETNVKIAFHKKKVSYNLAYCLFRIQESTYNFFNCLVI